MPQVPRLEQNIAQQGLPNVRVDTNAPIEAFGGGKPTSDIFDGASKVLDTGMAIFQEQKKKADQIATMDADRNLSELETKLQLDTQKMRGKDAAGAFDYVKDNWGKEVQKVKESLSNDEQRQVVDRAANSRWESLNRSTHVHAAKEMEAYDDQTTSGYIATSQSVAAINATDDAKVAHELLRQKAVLHDWASRKGLLENPAYAAKVQEVLSNTHKSVIDARLLTGDSKSARAYFETNKDQFDAKDLPNVTKSIEDGEVLTVGQETWNKVRGKQLSNGDPDLERQRAYVMGLDSITPQQKEKVANYVEARAQEAIRNSNQSDAALLNKFKNAVLETKKSGRDMTEALKLVPGLTKKVAGKADSEDEEAKKHYIRSLYYTKTESDRPTKVRLWEGIKEGTVTKEQVDKAFYVDKKINGEDWESLRHDFYTGMVEGQSHEIKQVYKRIDNLAIEKFGSNKLQSENFKYEMQQVGRGKSAEEIWALAQEKLKGDPSTGWISYDAYYKSDAKRRDANNLAWGDAKLKLGTEIVDAIGSHTLGTKDPATGEYRQSWGVSDIEVFANQLGGYDKIQAGTPANNAMQSLVKHKKPVTPSNVSHMLKKHPDGKF